MSSLLLALGAAIVLLAPLVVYVLLRSHEEGPGTGKAAAAAENTGGGKGQQPSPARREFAPAPEDARKAAVPRPPSAPRLLVQQPSRPQVQPFPSTDDVPVGMDKLKLLASFGKPNMITTEVTEGRALETFRYLRPELGVETTVFLRSGRVVSASSTYY